MHERQPSTHRCRRRLRARLTAAHTNCSDPGESLDSRYPDSDNHFDRGRSPRLPRRQESRLLFRSSTKYPGTIEFFRCSTALGPAQRKNSIQSMVSCDESDPVREIRARRSSLQPGGNRAYQGTFSTLALRPRLRSENETVSGPYGGQFVQDLSRNSVPKLVSPDSQRDRRRSGVRIPASNLLAHAVFHESFHVGLDGRGSSGWVCDPWKVRDAGSLDALGDPPIWIPVNAGRFLVRSATSQAAAR